MSRADDIESARWALGWLDDGWGCVCGLEDECQLCEQLTVAAYDAWQAGGVEGLRAAVREWEREVAGAD